MVLLYECEIWIVADAIMTVMEGFHHRVDRRIAGMTVRRGNDSDWELPPVATDLEVTVLWPMQENVRRRQDKIAEYIMGHSIFELCTRDERREVYSRFLHWWYQDHGQAEEEVDLK